MKEFEKELKQLINRHSIENEVDMPDFILAGMLCRMIEAMGPGIKRNLDWHGCDSVCHPAAKGSIFAHPKDVCPECGGTKMIDSGCETLWGPCPTCSPEDKP